MNVKTFLIRKVIYLVISTCKTNTATLKKSSLIKCDVTSAGGVVCLDWKHLVLIIHNTWKEDIFHRNMKNVALIYI